MDKSWIQAQIKSNAFKDGVLKFIDFARAKSIRGQIVCPCRKCCNFKWLCVETVHAHILRYGFLPGYTKWTFHGEHVIPSSVSHPSFAQETSFGQDDIRGMIHDAIGVSSPSFENEQEIDSTIDGDISEPEQNDQNPDHDVKGDTYKKLLEECDKELYPGCKYSGLSFTLHLYHVKCIGGISDKSFGMLLELLKNTFPHLTSIPSSVTEAKKLTKDLGLGYEKIDACPNDCMLYWGEREGQQSCHVCKAPRYESDVGEKMIESSKSNKSKKPAKVFRYFPLIPRLKRLYMSEKTAKDMRWHNTGLTKDGKLRHPADGLAWKAFDTRYPEFASDPRNVRLGFASDRFNPYRTMTSSYSTWPVVLIPYNLPPWICMKKESFILSSIIPGGKGPENDIDIYLQPLIQELKLLWEGVDAYDSFAKEWFKLKASLLWTVNDFPAYANLSGWSTKGRVACPCCLSSTRSIWLRNGKKFCYMGHRRWLDQNHSYRLQMDQFDGTIENEGPPIGLTGSDILKQLSGSSFMYGKSLKSKKRTRDDVGSTKSNTLHTDIANEESCTFEGIESFIEEDIDGENQLWKKKSIFFDLPYWEYNLLRHNLDVMHIEKNVCDNLLGTLLNIDGKTKDNEDTRKDLMEMGIQNDLHIKKHPNGKTYLPPASYTMSNLEKSNFLQVLKKLKVPDGYASNISRGVSLRDRKLFNLKSHDGHILMQDILPIALRISMLSRAQSRVVKVVSDFCSLFKGLCSKVLDLGELEKMEYQVVQTLCELLERLFPPSFFTIMVHLTIHLISEAKLGGPVHYRWMYPVERYLMLLKSYVRNKAQHEGSIAEGYVKEECLNFCSRYFEGVETRFNRPPRNDDNILGKEKYIFNSGGRSIGKVEVIELDSNSLSQAHRYVLLNHSKVLPFRDQFLNEKQACMSKEIDLKTMGKLIVEEFPMWLKHQVSLLEKNKFDEEVISLSMGPNIIARQYSGLITNGFRFLTRRREESKKTQNSGVCVEVEGGNYYGKLTNIIELEYCRGYKVVLFRCDWVDIRPSKGLKKDKYGFPLVNFSRPLIHTGEKLTDDPYIISSQAKQVFYIDDMKDIGWSHVIMTKPRDTYDMGTNLNGDDDDNSWNMYASRSAMQKHARSSLFSAQSQSQQASVFLQTPRPPFLSAIRQKYSSSSSCSHSEPPATTLNSEPSSTSLHSEPSTTSLHSEPSSTSLHSEPSTTSLHSEFSSHVSSFEKDYEKGCKTRLRS
ncbi:uncharacterized protein [Rutidosis leptorrhynchoides]|uniref:uncharacterized protein n=1 Tax=Rutidosis leptorrhynchoides TaxID=125765 RepID=UPI003A99A6B4